MFKRVTESGKSKVDGKVLVSERRLETLEDLAEYANKCVPYVNISLARKKLDHLYAENIELLSTDEGCLVHNIEECLMLLQATDGEFEHKWVEMPMKPKPTRKERG